MTAPGMGERRRLRRATRVAATMVLGAAALLVVTPSGAPALPPEDFGWWSKSQVGGGALPTVPYPAIVPPEGLYVAFDGTGPTAIAAVRYFVTEGAEATLSLRVAANNDADGPQNDRPVSIDACITTRAWDAELHGRFDSAPTYDCETVATPGRVEEDGGLVTWFFPPIYQETPGIIDMALVPGGTVPFQLAFEKPDETSLFETTLESEGDGGEFGNEGFEDFGSFDEGEEFGDAEFGVVPEPEGFYDTEGFEGEFVGEQDAPAGPGRSRGGRVPFRPVVAAIPDARGDRIVAVTVLMLIGVALWYIGGIPVRAPRLLGSLGSDKAAPVDTRGIRVGGVGRFSRTRSRPPTRL